MGVVNSKLKVNPRLRSIKREELKYNNAFQFNSSNELIQPLEECKDLFSDIGSTMVILISHYDILYSINGIFINSYSNTLYSKVGQKQS
jgi:hypothetical protein